MLTFKIAHIYYDLMNLYGERGNIQALYQHLLKQNINVSITNLSIEDKIDFANYDFFYIGSGCQESFEIALENILKYQKDIKKAINDNKFFLVTGNAIELFGQSFTKLNNETIKALDIFNFKSFETDFQIVGEQVLKFPDFPEEILAFQNRYSVMRFVKEKHLFEVIDGTGYVPKSIEEGIIKNNFYGTYLLGPLLIRNPLFTEYLVKQIMNYLSQKYVTYTDEIETLAYQEYLNYYKTKDN